MSHNLQLRVLTAFIALPLIVVVTIIGGWPFALVAAGVALLASAEFVHGWLFPSMPMSAAISQAGAFAASALMVGGAQVDPGFIYVGLAFAAVFAIIGYTPTNAFGPRKPWRVQCWCILYIGLLLSTLVLLRNVEAGRSWVFIALLTTFSIDTGAYATGKLIGRHKLAPAISPGKTWEGAIGGYIAGAGAFLLLNTLFDTGVSLARLSPLIVILPVAAMAGDLFESWMKRRMGVKDASGLLPGHGGFLDRLDSILFIVPLLYVFLELRVL